MNIAFFEIQAWEKQYLQKALSTHQLSFFTEPLNQKHVSRIKNTDCLSVFVHSQVDKKIINQLPQLKLITTRSTGFDHIDTKTASEKKITVCNVPFYGENTVAEHAFALLLSIARNIPLADQKINKKNYSIDGLKGFDLDKKILGVVGGGHIGIHAAQIGSGFGMRVKVFDIHPDQSLAKKFHFQYVAFDQLLTTADIITLHVPYNKHTHHLINKKNITKIKKGAILINTARGGVIDTAALLSALGKNITAAGLDVIEGEDLLGKKSLSATERKTLSLAQKVITKPNVLFTPHIAFFTQEALQRIIETTADTIKKFKAGKKVNTV